MGSSRALVLIQAHLFFDLDCCTLTTATTIRPNARGVLQVPPNRFAIAQGQSETPEGGRMTKPKHTMVPRRPAVLLALLASASPQTLLPALPRRHPKPALVA